MDSALKETVDRFNQLARKLEIKVLPLEKEMATYSSILAWKSPWTEEPGGLQSMGLHDQACVHEGGGRWVGSNKLVELKKKNKKQKNSALGFYLNLQHTTLRSCL